MMGKKKSEHYRGQLMLQIAAGRYFRPDIPLREHLHRRTFYTNVSFPFGSPIGLPVGTVLFSTEIAGMPTATLEAIDRLEAQGWDGTEEVLIATGGNELLDDIAYVMSFSLNRTFMRDYDQMRRLVLPEGRPVRPQGAPSLFPQLFASGQLINSGALDELKSFMDALLQLPRVDFARAMRVIRNSVDATRRAADDPTGAYTDLVAALESLSEDSLTMPTTWDRYDSSKRKIIDAALCDLDEEQATRVRSAVLEADRAGLKRRFIASTLAKVSPDFYRTEAKGTIRPPRSAELERMLSIAYDIRSRRSHVLENLSHEAWVHTDGAETTFEPSFQRVLTLAGLWRLLRHVLKRYVEAIPPEAPEPWDYRDSLPGVIQMQLAPQYWIWQHEHLDSKSALKRFCAVAEAIIDWRAGHNQGFDLTQVVEKIEKLVPCLPEGDEKTALIAIHVLWHQISDPKDQGSTAEGFLKKYALVLDKPSAIAYTTGLLSNHRPPAWTPEQWADLADSRRASRVRGKEAPLPPAIDALIQIEAADQLEAAGNHHEAIKFAANAVEECPGDDAVLLWEHRLISGDHDPGFDVHKFLFGKTAVEETAS
ncbi:hypothetical protein [Arthrobacter globiformis]|uniref:hypothetical protein n=1 Tax=Arthrobacter globiformis TaxID=1665 RepID=UPI0027819E29|nr:hypothetical protein [Arthrobacter globiformis]MDQ0867406.1 hypothetical protein [Arthrobacter globiformis]